MSNTDSAAETQWTATVRYVVDGTTKDATFTGHHISSQMFDGSGSPPYRTLVEVHAWDGPVVEVWQGYAWTVHKTRHQDEDYRVIFPHERIGGTTVVIHVGEPEMVPFLAQVLTQLRKQIRNTPPGAFRG